MIEKKGKEYKESLSKAGKESVIQAFLKLSGYKVSSPDNRKRKKYYNLYLDELKNLNDDLVIVKVYETSMDEEMKKVSENEKKKKQEKKEKQGKPQKHEKINLHQNINKIKKSNDLNDDTGPPCTKYNPKMSSIYPRLILGPNWNSITGRKYKKIEPDEKDFLITHDSIIDNEKKSLVNMNKDTERGSYFGITDVRIRTDKKFDYKLNFKLRKKLAKIIKKNENKTQKYNKSENKKNKDNLKLSISNSNIFKDRTNPKRKENSKNKKDNEQTIPDNNKIDKIQSRNQLSAFKTLQIQNKSNIKKDGNKGKNVGINNDYIYPKKHMRTIDFSKILSREKREKALTKKRFIDLFHDADHSPIFERPRIFTYQSLENQTPIQKKFTGYKSYIDYDSNKAHNIRIVHPFNKVPNFNLILPRPEENKNLPTFMQKMFNRNAEYTFNDKALNMNEYSNQKLGKTITSFFPKKSFNYIVNMNLMNGRNFEEDYKIEDIDIKRNEIKNRMKIKNKNIGKLIKEGALKRFDNVSLRTIHKTKNIMVGDLNKYLFGLKES